MTDKNHEAPDTESLRTVTDEEIVTERKVPRRSFLGATGAVLAGAAGIVTGATATGLHHPPQDDPDKKPADPDKKPSKKEDETRKKADDASKKADDAPKKADDPQKKAADPDKKPADPDKPNPQR